MSNPTQRAFDNATRDARVHRGDAPASLRRRLFGRASRILRAALPQACALCAGPAGNTLVCARCTDELPWLAPACDVCALPADGAAICGACLAHPPPFSATVAAFSYAFPVDRLLRELKYGGRLAHAEWLASHLARAVAAALRQRDRHTAPDCVIALPLAKSRQRERGFNQAREIAACVARELRLPLAHPLDRVTGGLPQAALRWSARAANVRGAFVARALPRSARVALVDDVMTTGATLAAAAQALRDAGAARVECWVVARTPSPGAA